MWWRLVVLATSASMPSRRKVLALHGKEGTGASFRGRLEPLVSATGDVVDWIFVDAPFPVGDGGEKGRQWWTLPPGVRSFNADSYGGVDESLRLIDRTLEEHEGAVDAVLGFSQGAMLLSVWLAEKLLQRMNGADVLIPAKAVIVGCAWPKPFGATLEQLRAVPAERFSFIGSDSLHVVGRADQMNPPEQGRAVSECFGPTARVLVHEGGHVVPMDPEALAVMSQFITEGCASEEACEV